MIQAALQPSRGHRTSWCSRSSNCFSAWEKGKIRHIVTKKPKTSILISGEVYPESAEQTDSGYGQEMSERVTSR